MSVPNECGCGCREERIETKLDLERQKVEFAELKANFADLQASIADADAHSAERETAFVWRLFLFGVGVIGIIIATLAFVVPLLIGASDQGG